MKKEIEKYKLEGKISCWKFINNRNYSGWNICFDEKAKAGLMVLIDKMNKSEWPSKKDLNLCDPLELNQQWIEKTGKYKVAKVLTISNRKTPEKLWEILNHDNELLIKMGDLKLIDFQNMIKNNAFDEGISGVNEDDSQILKFW